MKQIKFKITGITGIYLHSDAAVDPLGPHSKAMKQISSKRNKTEADHEQLSKLEFSASLYWDDTDGVILPAKMLRAVIVAGSKKDKNGPVVSAGVLPAGHAKLIYPEHETISAPDDLYKKDYYRRDSVVVSRARLIRTRPYFENWSAEVSYVFDPSIVNQETIELAMKKAGSLCGIGDWRPLYGKFKVETISCEDMADLL